MAYNEQLANRIREYLTRTHDSVEEKRMFSGLCFMVNDKMCVALNEQRLMARIDPMLSNELIEKEGVALMEMKGKPLKGYVTVDNEILKMKNQLEYWLNLALAYNQFAKSSKRRKKMKR